MVFGSHLLKEIESREVLVQSAYLQISPTVRLLFQDGLHSVQVGTTHFLELLLDELFEYGGPQLLLQTDWLSFLLLFHFYYKVNLKPIITY